MSVSSFVFLRSSPVMSRTRLGRVGRLALAFLFQIILLGEHTNAQTVVDAGNGEVVLVQAVSGGTAELPCDITLSQPNDSVLLVVWYRDDAPIYSWDARAGDSTLHMIHSNQASHETAGLSSAEDADLMGDKDEGGTHWSGFAGVRARWSPLGARLALRPADAEDRGEYRCRADFRASPSKNTKVHLQIIEAAGTPVIVDEAGRELKESAGPYREGDSPKLTCSVTGGYPPATLRWYRGGRVQEGASNGVLKLTSLKRSDLLAALTCQASNSPLLPPTTSTLVIDMQLPPLSVEIIERDPLSAGREQEIVCKAKGARPPPQLSWWLNGERLEGVQVDEEFQRMDGQEEGSISSGTPSVSTSTLKFTARAQQHGQKISCHAKHVLLASHMEAQMSLNVLFPPSVNLTLGSNLNPNDIEEGDDVYFECKIHANPPPYKLVWNHNGQPLIQDPKGSITITSGNLVMQRVSRTAAGSYSCDASNVEGDAHAQPVVLNIMFKPVCIASLRQSYGVARQERAQLVCEVEAVPPPDSFTWSLNNSAQVLEVPAERYTWSRTPARSTLAYTPVSELDYGTALCWASNLVGKQVQPCALTLLPASRPHPPANCSMVNQTSVALEIICDPGYDGGLLQTFQLEVYERPIDQLLANVSARRPGFTVSGLAPGKMMKVIIYAHNSRGRSETVLLDTFTLEIAEKQTGTESVLEISSWLGVVAGALGGTLILVLLAGVAIRLRRRAPTDYTLRSGKPKGLCSRTRPPRSELLVLHDDKNPDVVPLNKATEHKVSLEETTTSSDTAETPGGIGGGVISGGGGGGGVGGGGGGLEGGGPPRPPPYTRAPPLLTHTIPVGRAGREVVTTRAPLPAAQESDV